MVHRGFKSGMERWRLSDLSQGKQWVWFPATLTVSPRRHSGLYLKTYVRKSCAQCIKTHFRTFTFSSEVILHLIPNVFDMLFWNTDWLNWQADIGKRWNWKASELKNLRANWRKLKWQENEHTNRESRAWKNKWVVISISEDWLSKTQRKSEVIKD